MPKLGLHITKVAPDTHPDGKNHRFEASGYVGNAYTHCWVEGYVGMTGKTLHVDKLPTFSVSLQREILQHIEENEKRLIAKIKKMLNES